MSHRFLYLFSFLFIFIFSFTSVYAYDALDAEGYPVMYVRGSMTDNWSVNENYRMTRQGNTYSITLSHLNGEFKVSGTEWNFNYGANGNEKFTISDAKSFNIAPNGPNLIADNLNDVTVKFDFVRDENGSLTNSMMYISANGNVAPDPDKITSGTLPVLYINVMNDDGNSYNNEIIDRNLSHKNYFTGTYWLDLNGCEYFESAGAESIGSKDSPLPLQIKARGNYTRTGFAKKPFKLKLEKKQSLLGMSKSKHYAILAHADDNFGYLRNFTGFNLGKRIGLPWTPSQQPVEVVINGDYRGLYFLTESIRIESDRINITELDDNVEEGSLISGGYLIELDNYDEDNQIRMTEKSFIGGYSDVLRITFDTPEEYSDLQRRFITEQFTAMNDAVGSCSDNLWAYMDMDDAVRYYIVNEMVSHVEAYHGSTYLFRDFGEGQKWHFSPLWDMGNAFSGANDKYIYKNSPFGNTWIASIRENNKFNARLHDTWMWFMTNGYDGLMEDIDNYVNLISEAAKTDRARWRNAPLPDTDNRTPVVDNSDMESRRNEAVKHLISKIAWLCQQWGDYRVLTTPADEPMRDTTPAASLPYYARPAGVDNISIDTDNNRPVYFNLQGIQIAHPSPGNIYIRIADNKAEKVIF